MKSVVNNNGFVRENIALQTWKSVRPYQIKRVIWTSLCFILLCCMLDIRRGSRFSCFKKFSVVSYVKVELPPLLLGSCACFFY